MRATTTGGTAAVISLLAPAVSQITTLWPSVPQLSIHLCQEEQRAGGHPTPDGTAARRSLIFLDDLFVHAVEQPAREQAEQDALAVVATRGDRAIAFAALHKRLLGESCLMARVDVRQHRAGEVMLYGIHLTLARLYLEISPLAVHYLAQGCLRLAQQAQTYRGGEVPHAVSLARQTSFALRYRVPEAHQRAPHRGRSIRVSFSKEQKDR